MRSFHNLREGIARRKVNLPFAVISLHSAYGQAKKTIIKTIDYAHKGYLKFPFTL